MDDTDQSPIEVTDKTGKKIGSYVLNKFPKDLYETGSVPMYEMHVFGLDNKRVGMVSVCKHFSVFRKDGAEGMGQFDGGIPVEIVTQTVPIILEMKDKGTREISMAILKKMSEIIVRFKPPGFERLN